jgi:hypothetical protein
MEDLEGFGIGFPGDSDPLQNCWFFCVDSSLGWIHKVTFYESMAHFPVIMGYSIIILSRG